MMKAALHPVSIPFLQVWGHGMHLRNVCLQYNIAFIIMTKGVAPADTPILEDCNATGSTKNFPREWEKHLHICECL